MVTQRSQRTLLIAVCLLLVSVSSAANAVASKRPSAAKPVDNAYLSAVSASSADDVWAVGTHGPYGHQRSLIEHWDGASWSRVASPSPGRDFTGLGAVAAVARDDAWAVGSYRLLGKMYTLVLHWDGSTWTRVPAPSPSPRASGLGSIYANSPTDIWAVGTRLRPKPDVNLPLVEHWDGTSWQVVRVPRPDEDNSVFGVTGTSATDVTFVGGAECCREDDRPFAEQWDGTAWSLTYPISSESGYLFAAYAVASDDEWAVGEYDGGGPSLIAHSDGTTWSTVPLKSPPESQLWGLDGTGSNDVWAVGGSQESGGVAHTLIEHWNGARWSEVPGPKLGDDQRPEPLQGVAALALDDAWAVGGYFDSTKQVEIALVAHWNGHKWTTVPTP